ncbi:MAG: hypothetical protein ACKOTE_05120 [Opitutaceae bacterium]
MVAKEAAELLEPRVWPVHLTSVVPRTDTDVRRWPADPEKTLLGRIESGPVLIA